MNSLLPPNASALERAAEQMMARLSRIPTPLADLWNPDTYPAPLLPWLAWAVSVDHWQATWPESIKRQLIRSALSVARHKGTVASLREVIASFGGTMHLVEWWQTDPPGAPHTFELILTLSGQDGSPTSAAFVDEVIAAVRRVKPARSHFTFTQGLQAHARIQLISAARGAVHRRQTHGSARLVSPRPRRGNP